VAVPANVSELGVNLSQRCFAYPADPPGRLHGPQGYSHYEAYRDWLRDEFSFRCAYCLMRETWLRGKSGFQIDHCLPYVADPSRFLDYDNLVYTCPWCNQAKAGVSVPNPAEVGYGMALRVNEDGVIDAGNQLGSILLEGLKLDHPEITYQRRMVLRVVRLAEEKNNVAIVLRLLGYPDDLPNLKQKRPPGGNSRQAGIHNSGYEKRRRGELPLLY
jgi:hypothetical protein